MNNKILVVDLETTGLSSFYDKILEVGIVELNLYNGEVKLVYHKLFRPDVKFKDLKKIWLIQNKYIDLREIMISDVMTQRDLNQIQLIVSDYTMGITAYNNVFDFGFLKANGIDLEHKLDCPMKVCTDILKLPGNGKSYKWPSFQQCFDYYFPNTKYVEKHRAVDDAMKEAKVIYEMYKLGEFKIEQN